MQLIQKARAFHLSSFQFFLVKQKTQKYITLTEKDRTTFVNARRSFGSDLYIHSAYWINPAAFNKNIYALSRSLLKRELRLAQILEIKYLVLHPGSARGHHTTVEDPEGKIKGIHTLARMLNNILRNESYVSILLENCAHGKKTIGSDLNDFVLLKKELNHPEKIGFCIDTAHAFSYGYDLEPIDDFVALLDKTLGIANIKLIHFNDTYDTQGSMLDRHAIPGQGKIGKKTLQLVLHHPKLAPIPKIIEGPGGPKQISLHTLEDICNW